MAKTPLGITYTATDGQSSTGVYESESGIETFETDVPYLLSDDNSLASPLPVFDAGGPTFLDSMGNVQSALAVKGMTPPILGITWDSGQTWDNGTYWS